MRVAHALVLIGLLASCGGDELSSLALRIEYAQDSCGNQPVNSAFFEMRGTVGLHVLDAAQDGGVLAAQCVVLEPLAFRALNDLPQVLQDNFALEPLPEDARVRVQVSVYDAVVPCLPYRADTGQAIPKFFGTTDAISLAEEPAIINVAMGCL